MKKLEEVARAIFAELRRQDGDMALGEFQELERIRGGHGTLLDGSYDLVAVTRAAIEAMREPTAKMVLAAEYADPTVSVDYCPFDISYRAMIDAILSEGDS